MIYFDNAATTKYKPEEVYDAVNFYLREIGVSPGRGSYSLGINASRMLYQSRCTIGAYFGLSHPERVLFTKNSTEAINLFFNGFLKAGDHVIITCYEHNAVLRPLHHLKELGVIDYSIISREDLLLQADEIFKKYVKPNTRLFATTLASNLSGRIVYREDLLSLMHNNEISTFIDSSQGAGKVSINMQQQNIDFLAFTGHKDLLGIPGIGGLCCESSIKIEPLIQGGTGIHGENYVNPDIFPEGYEAGTLNMPAIWGLKAGIEFINKNSEKMQVLENSLMDYLIESLSIMDNIILYDSDFTRVPTCCFNIKGQPSDKTIAFLDQHGICARGGIHCAILAHEALGTVSTGAVRISLNYQNTKEEISELLTILQSR